MPLPDGSRRERHPGQAYGVRISAVASPLRLAWCSGHADIPWAWPTDAIHHTLTPFGALAGTHRRGWSASEPVPPGHAQGRLLYQSRANSDGDVTHRDQAYAQAVGERRTRAGGIWTIVSYCSRTVHSSGAATYGYRVQSRPQRSIRNIEA